MTDEKKRQGGLNEPADLAQAVAPAGPVVATPTVVPPEAIQNYQGMQPAPSPGMPTAAPGMPQQPPVQIKPYNQWLHEDSGLYQGDPNGVYDGELADRLYARYVQVGIAQMRNAGSGGYNGMSPSQYLNYELAKLRFLQSQAGFNLDKDKFDYQQTHDQEIQEQKQLSDRQRSWLAQAQHFEKKIDNLVQKYGSPENMEPHIRKQYDKMISQHEYWYNKYLDSVGVTDAPGYTGGEEPWPVPNVDQVISQPNIGQGIPQQTVFDYLRQKSTYMPKPANVDPQGHYAGQGVLTPPPGSVPPAPAAGPGGERVRIIWLSGPHKGKSGMVDPASLERANVSPDSYKVIP